MDCNEAIKAIKSNYPPSNYTMLREGLDLAIEALEKQIPKKPLEQRYVNLNEIENELMGHCPSCRLKWDVAYWQRHCGNCGQKLDWKEGEKHEKKNANA